MDCVIVMLVRWFKQWTSEHWFGEGNHFISSRHLTSKSPLQSKPLSNHTQSTRVGLILTQVTWSLCLKKISLVPSILSFTIIKGPPVNSFTLVPFANLTGSSFIRITPFLNQS